MKKIISLFTLLSATAYFNAQTVNASTSENYIYTKTCLDGNCTKKSEQVQYFDDLGRLKQAVDIKATPSGKDIVAHIQYDEFGRVTKEYMPVPQNGTQNGAIYADPLSNAVNIFGNEKIYSEKELENSPLGRIKKVTPPGNDFTAHPSSITYAANTAGEVKKYTVSTSWQDNATLSALSENGTYAANQLTKNSVTDADGNITTEFKNSDGNTVLVRKNDGTQNVDTYYVYNEFGQQVIVIPPMAAVAAVNQTALDNLCYQYRYDGLGRLVEKKLPGKGWEYMVYDKADRLIATQDAILRPAGKWLFTKYDKLGRVIYTGIIQAANRPDLQTITSNYVITEERNQQGFFRNGMQIYYTDVLYANAETILSVNYYDTYPQDAPSRPAQVLGQNILTDNMETSLNTKNLLTVSLIKNIEDDNWTKNYIWYDEKSRAVGTYSINHLGGYTKTESLLDFAGVTQLSKVYHKRLTTDTEKVITQTFEYDAQNRLKKHYHQVDSQPQELLTENTYNELSRLSNKKIGNNLQSIDYAYDVRGSLTKVNDPANLNGKLFGYELKYNNPANTAAKFNGTISEVDWRTANDNVLRRYTYQYDGLNRLKKGAYSEPGSSVPQNDFYNETVTYDMNSNIMSLQRNTKGVSGTASQIDNLTYAYTGNRLNSVTDSSTNYSGYPDTSGNTISYDDNGNMKNHTDKGVLQIDYNFHNLPAKITFNQTYRIRNAVTGNLTNRNVTTNYTFRADGTKLRKVYKYGGDLFVGEVSISTDYLDGFQYESQTTSSPFILKFVPTAEGYYNFENNKYIYSYTDHLGNVRLSYTQNGSGPEIIEENNFYPFGMKHEGYNALAGNPAYNYGYNGKELQKETGWSDYGARMYMSDIARWGVIDPLAETSRRFSPYNYALNNPVSFIDPDGRRAMTPIGAAEGGAPGGSLWWYYAGGGSAVLGSAESWMGAGTGAGRGGSHGGGGFVKEAQTYGQASGGLSFSSLSGIIFAQAYFGGGGSIAALFSMVEQLEAANFKDPVNKDAKFSDIQNLVKKVPALAELYKATKAEFIDNTGGDCPNKTEYQRIWINMNNIGNILKLAFTAGHEMNHSFADQFFKDQFGEITRQSKSSLPFRDSFGFFQEVMGLSWEIKLGSERYGDRSGFEAAKFYYGPNGLGYSQKSVDTVNKYLYDLKNSWDLVYQSKIK